MPWSSARARKPLLEILDRLAGGNRDLSNIPGCVGLDGSAGSTAAHDPLDRPLKDIDTFPAHDYSLIQVERYFLLKKRRQLDYISSQGCRFRCSFCADPLVYRRGWFGLAPKPHGRRSRGPLATVSLPGRRLSG